MFCLCARDIYAFKQKNKTSGGVKCIEVEREQCWRTKLNWIFHEFFLVMNFKCFPWQSLNNMQLISHQPKLMDRISWQEKSHHMKLIRRVWRSSFSMLFTFRLAFLLDETFPLRRILTLTTFKIGDLVYGVLERIISFRKFIAYIIRYKTSEAKTEKDARKFSSPFC